MATHPTAPAPKRIMKPTRLEDRLLNPKKRRRSVSGSNQQELKAPIRRNIEEMDLGTATGGEEDDEDSMCHFDSSSGSSSGEEEEIIIAGNSGQLHNKNGNTHEEKEDSNNSNTPTIKKRRTPRRNARRATPSQNSALITNTKPLKPKRGSSRRAILRRASIETTSQNNSTNQDHYNHYEVGDEVAVYFERDDKWYEAVIRDIFYEEVPNSSSSSRQSRGTERAEKRLNERAKSYPRRKSAASSSGSTVLKVSNYTIEYDNGEVQENVCPENVLDRMNDANASDMDQDE